MADGSMSLSVDKKIVETVVMQKITAEVASALSTVKDDLIDRLVRSIATQKVDHQGNFSNNNWGYEQTLIEHLVKSQIKKLATEAMAKLVEENRPVLEKKIREAMKKNQGQFIDAFMQGMTKQLTNTWNVKLDVQLSKE